MFIRSAGAPALDLGDGVTRQVLGHDAELMMVRVTFAGGAVGALHAHPHHQVTFIERGYFEVTIGSSTTVLGPGDSFLVPPDTVHGVVALEDSALLDVFAPAREDFL